MTNSGRYRFGSFEFDTASLELRRAGVLVRLQSQPAQVLSCLIMQAGQVVSREVLCEAVWHAETFVDFERGLNFCIAQIRSSLADDSTDPRYVRTIPKRGYQFIAPVEQVLLPSVDVIPPSPEQTVEDSGRSRLPAKRWALSCALILLVIGFYAGYRMRSAPPSKQPPIVAIARFDNDTGDASMTRLSDGLTDSLVEQLTSLSHQRYGVVGNAQILRVPRDQRDLEAISRSIAARYVVLGQVQGFGSQTRILAHLIRLPDQTHIWVTRMDHSSADPLSLESDVAQKIASDFSRRIVEDASGRSLPSFPNN